MSLKIYSDFNRDTTLRFKIKDGWDRAGEQGEYFGKISVNDMIWALVLFDGEDDPDLHKADSLLVGYEIWESVFYDEEKL